MSLATRMFLTSLVLGVAVISPDAALGAPQRHALPLVGKGTMVVTVNGSSLTSTSSGQLSHLGAYAGSYNGLFTGPGPGFTTTGTETLVAANGDKLVGTGKGNGAFLPNSLVVTGTYVVTITGGTGRFDHAIGTYTVTYTGPVTFNGSIATANLTTTISGEISPATPPQIVIGDVPPNCTRNDVRLRVSISDANTVHRVRVFLDGRLIRTPAGPVFRLSIPIDSVGVGGHLVRVSAVDTRGSVGVTSRVFSRCGVVVPKFVG